MTDARTAQLIGLEQEVGVFVRRVRRVIGLRAAAVHPDLQPSSYVMLGHVAEHGPVRASVVAEAFDIDKGAISRQIGHLVELGLVTRVPDPEDGRASLVTATPMARRRLEDVVLQRRQWLDERLGEWSDDELSDFVASMGRYNEALSDISVPV